jgi:hypothetical protein
MNTDNLVKAKTVYEEMSKKVTLQAKQCEPRLPDGTPTRLVPCRFCGCLGGNHLKGGACIGPIDEMPATTALPLPPSQSYVIQCPRRCEIYCAPGGIEILS